MQPCRFTADNITKTKNLPHTDLNKLMDFPTWRSKQQNDFLWMKFGTHGSFVLTKLAGSLYGKRAEAIYLWSDRSWRAKNDASTQLKASYHPSSEQGRKRAIIQNNASFKDVLSGSLSQAITTDHNSPPNCEITNKQETTTQSGSVCHKITSNVAWRYR